MLDDSTRRAVLAAIETDVTAVLEWLGTASDLDLATAEQTTRQRLLAAAGQVLNAGLAARGTGQAGPRIPCACGALATFEGYRPKGVQTLVGWIEVRRAYYACPACGHGQAPLDAALGVARDSHSPGVRRLASQFGALLPFGPAATLLATAAGVQLSRSTVRVVTEATGTRREQALTAAEAHAWTAGVPASSAGAPDRLYVAMDGVRILSTTGEGREVKVGVVQPVRRTTVGEERDPASYAASLAPAEAFGRRLALEAQRRGLEGTAAVAVLGDGAAWIWNLAEDHFPQAVQIVDWFHASERIWQLGRALSGAERPETTAWVSAQLDRLAKGDAARLAETWRALPCRGEAAAARDEQATYFTNQASRMAYDRYRAAGWDIGSGMVESACKYVIGAREKGPGMHWSDAGAQTVAQLRVLLCNQQWDAFWQAA